MSEFRNRFKAAGRLFEPKVLKHLLKRHRERLALLVIDVQNHFASPQSWRANEKTTAVAHRINMLAQRFRKAHIPVYAVRSTPDKHEMTDDDRVNMDKYDYYAFQFDAKKDVEIIKHGNSALRGTDLVQRLRKTDRKMLLACGFNRSACVHDTLLDAAHFEAFNVCMIRDLTANDARATHCANQADETSDLNWHTWKDADRPHYVARLLLAQRQNGIQLAPERAVLKMLGLR